MGRQKRRVRGKYFFDDWMTAFLYFVLLYVSCGLGKTKYSATLHGLPLSFPILSRNDPNILQFLLHLFFYLIFFLTPFHLPIYARVYDIRHSLTSQGLYSLSVHFVPSYRFYFFPSSRSHSRLYTSNHVGNSTQQSAISNKTSIH
jgi:hypothetical protein